MKPTLAELDLICDAVGRLYGESVAPQMEHADLDKACAYMYDAWYNGKLLIVGDFAVLFSVGTTWYSSTIMVFEELVIRFRKEVGNPVSDVVPLLDNVREEYGAKAIITGDAQRGLMAPVYLNAGFVPAGIQFFKG